MDNIIEFLKSRKYKSFIDVGCSYGGTTASVKRELPDITVLGIDLAENFIEQARGSFPEVRFLVADIRRSLKVGKFDLAYTHGVFQHIEHKDVERAIKNVMKIARDGLFIESQGQEIPGNLKYVPKAYWNNRVGQKEPSPIDFNTQYYFLHDYRRIFKKLGYKVRVLRDFKDKQGTKIYLCQKLLS